MKPRFKRIFIYVFIVLLIGGAALGGAVAYDTYCDRQHTVMITGPVRVYRLDHPDPTNPVVAVLDRGAAVQVLRIRYGKDYQTIRIRLSNGPEGYLISADSGNNYQLSE